MWHKPGFGARGGAAESRKRPNGGYGETPGKLLTLK